MQLFFATPSYRGAPVMFSAKFYASITARFEFIRAREMNSLSSQDIYIYSLEKQEKEGEKEAKIEEDGISLCQLKQLSLDIAFP